MFNDGTIRAQMFVIASENEAKHLAVATVGRMQGLGKLPTGQSVHSIIKVTAHNMDH